MLLLRGRSLRSPWRRGATARTRSALNRRPVVSQNMKSVALRFLPFLAAVFLSACAEGGYDDLTRWPPYCSAWSPSPSLSPPPLGWTGYSVEATDPEVVRDAKAIYNGPDFAERRKAYNKAYERRYGHFSDEGCANGAPPPRSPAEGAARILREKSPTDLERSTLLLGPKGVGGLSQ